MSVAYVRYVALTSRKVEIDPLAGRTQWHLFLVQGVHDVSRWLSPRQITHVHSAFLFHSRHVRMWHFHLQCHDAVPSGALVVELTVAVTVCIAEETGGKST